MQALVYLSQRSFESSVQWSTPSHNKKDVGLIRRSHSHMDIFENPLNPIPPPLDLISIKWLTNKIKLMNKWIEEEEGCALHWPSSQDPSPPDPD